jgi:hypothetical protein
MSEARGWHHTQAQAEYLRLWAHRPRLRTLSATRLVEFRCPPKAGHLLGVIYKSRFGPLFVSLADDLEVLDLVSMKGLAVQFPEDAARAKKAGWDPSPRLPLVDEPFAEDPCPLNCRCGSWPPLTREALKWALSLPPGRRNRPIIIVMTRQALIAPSDTLSLQS